MALFGTGHNAYAAAGRSPGGSPPRGAVSGTTGRAPGGCPVPRGPSGGCQVQRRPGTLLALGRCRWPVQMKTAAKPTPGPRTSRGGLGLREVDQRREGLREGVQVQRRQGSPWGSAAGHWPGVPWSGARINRPGAAQLTSAARASGRVSGPAPAGDLARPGALPLAGPDEDGRQADTGTSNQPRRAWAPGGCPAPRGPSGGCPDPAPAGDLARPRALPLADPDEDGRQADTGASNQPRRAWAPGG